MEFAYEMIFRKIMSEELLPGAQLREDHLAKEFGISSTPVREAFRRLEHEGWLESIPYRGSFLRKFSETEMQEMCTLREILEGMAAKLAAQNASHDDLKKIRSILDAEIEYIKNNSDGKNLKIHPTFQQDLDFHHAVAEICGNELLSERLAKLKAQIHWAFMLEHKRETTIAELERTFEEHRMIYNAIKRHWADAAELLMRCHISGKKS